MNVSNMCVFGEVFGKGEIGWWTATILFVKRHNTSTKSIKEEELN